MYFSPIRFLLCVINQNGKLKYTLFHHVQYLQSPSFFKLYDFTATFERWLGFYHVLEEHARFSYVLLRSLMFSYVLLCSPTFPYVLLRSLNVLLKSTKIFFLLRDTVIATKRLDLYFNKMSRTRYRAS